MPQRHPSWSRPSRSPCSTRLALVCRLFGILFRMLAVLCTQQRCSRVVGHTSPSAFQNPSAPPTSTEGSAFRARPTASTSATRSASSPAIATRPSTSTTDMSACAPTASNSSGQSLPGARSTERGSEKRQVGPPQPCRFRVARAPPLRVNPARP
jgi:hypothetical protein